MIHASRQTHTSRQIGTEQQCGVTSPPPCKRTARPRAEPQVQERSRSVRDTSPSLLRVLPQLTHACLHSSSRLELGDISPWRQTSRKRHWSKGWMPLSGTRFLFVFYYYLLTTASSAPLPLGLSLPQVHISHSCSAGCHSPAFLPSPCRTDALLQCAKLCPMSPIDPLRTLHRLQVTSTRHSPQLRTT